MEQKTNNASEIYNHYYSSLNLDQKKECTRKRKWISFEEWKELKNWYIEQENKLPKYLLKLRYGK